MITAGPPDGSAASASAAENVVPSAEVSSSLSAPAPPAIRGRRTRSAGRSGGGGSKAKHTAPLLGWAGSAGGSYVRSAAVVDEPVHEGGQWFGPRPAKAVARASRVRAHEHPWQPGHAQRGPTLHHGHGHVRRGRPAAGHAARHV